MKIYREDGGKFVLVEGELRRVGEDGRMTQISGLFHYYLDDEGVLDIFDGVREEFYDPSDWQGVDWDAVVHLVVGFGEELDDAYFEAIR